MRDVSPGKLGGWYAITAIRRAAIVGLYGDRASEGADNGSVPGTPVVHPRHRLSTHSKQLEACGPQPVGSGRRSSAASLLEATVSWRKRAWHGDCCKHPQIETTTQMGGVMAGAWLFGAAIATSLAASQAAPKVTAHRCARRVERAGATQPAVFMGVATGGMCRTIGWLWRWWRSGNFAVNQRQHRPGRRQRRHPCLGSRTRPKPSWLPRLLRRWLRDVPTALRERAGHGQRHHLLNIGPEQRDAILLRGNGV